MKLRKICGQELMETLWAETYENLWADTYESLWAEETYENLRPET
jgi:hypothetical protein